MVNSQEAISAGAPGHLLVDARFPMGACEYLFQKFVAPDLPLG